MIDTIHLNIPFDDIPGDYFNNTFKNYKKIEKTTDSEGISTFYTHVDNFRVGFGRHGLTIKGSIPKYYFGTNQFTLTYQDFIKAILKLEEELEIKLDKAKVLRIDIAENIITKLPPPHYYKHFSTLGYFNRSEQSKGLSYSNGNRYITFYDKVAESNKNKNKVCKLFNGGNVLRYEFRFLKHQALASFLGLKTVRLEDIVLQYSKLIDEWERIFNDIPKIKHENQLPKRKFLSEHGLEKYWMLTGITAIGGELSAITQIDEAKRLGAFKYPNQSSNLKNKVKAISALAPTEDAQGLIDELDWKIGMAATYARHCYQPTFS